MAPSMAPFPVPYEKNSCIKIDNTHTWQWLLHGIAGSFLNHLHFSESLKTGYKVEKHQPLSSSTSSIQNCQNFGVAQVDPHFAWENPGKQARPLTWSAGQESSLKVLQLDSGAITNGLSIGEP